MGVVKDVKPKPDVMREGPPLHHRQRIKIMKPKKLCALTCTD